MQQLLTRELLSSYSNVSTYKEGEQIYSKGAVKIILNHTHLIQANVLENKIVYTSQIELTQSGFVFSCTCQKKMKKNCVHIAATGFKILLNDYAVLMTTENAEDHNLSSQKSDYDPEIQDLISIMSQQQNIIPVLEKLSDLELVILNIITLTPGKNYYKNNIIKIIQTKLEVSVLNLMKLDNIDFQLYKLNKLNLIAFSKEFFHFSQIKKYFYDVFKFSTTREIRKYFRLQETRGYIESWELNTNFLILSALLSNDEKRLNEFLHRNYEELSNIYTLLFYSPIRLELMNNFTDSIRISILDILYNKTLSEIAPITPLIQYFESLETRDEYTKYFLFHLYAIRGDIDSLKQVNSPHTNAIAHLLENDIDACLQNINTIYYKVKKNETSINFSLYILLALIVQNDEIYNALFDNINSVGLKKNKHIKSFFNLFLSIKYFKNNNTTEAKRIIQDFNLQQIKYSELLIFILVKHWFHEFTVSELEQLKTILYKAVKNEYWTLATTIYDILTEKNFFIDSNNTKQIQQIKDSTGLKGLTKIYKKLEEWELALNGIIGNIALKSNVNKGIDRRVIWLLELESCFIQPKEQTLDKKGNWSAGKNIALKRLYDHEVENLSEQDLRIVACITKNNTSYYRDSEYIFSYDKCLKEMIGHPLLFSYKDPDVNIELIKGQPEISVNKVGNKFEISFNEEFKEKGIKIIKETANRFRLIEITQELVLLKITFGKNKVIVPERGQEKLQNAINVMSSIVTVHADKLLNSNIPSIKANSQTYLHLFQQGEGLKIEFFVKPFTTKPPYFRPGAGGKIIFTQLEGKKVQAIRDLDAEINICNDFISSCPSLSQMEDINNVWAFEQPEECLQFLLELEEAKNKIVVEWPEGEKMRIKHRFSFKNLNMSINSASEWFAINGNLTVDEKQVMDIRELLELLEENKTNFIPLGNGDFIALTKEFRKRLDEMNAFMEHSKDGELKINNLFAFAVKDIFDEFEVKADKKWKETIKNIKTTLKIKPKIPDTLEAELRPYQIDGYNWLYRLSKWGIGACLADDMGLGKTIQAIALLIERAKDGHALVIAPASVCNNWVKEINKFAPTLTPIFYADQRDILANLNQQDILLNLNQQIILITTYGLLQSNIKDFTSIKWNTVILDEAQAIKNAFAKRSQAVLELNANFRLITTGTPIQNHLGELWSLFNFINPGLLGSLKHFNDKYAVPIEKNKDVIKRNQLKKLIQPFILRRNKTQVLDELPEKTEITINVELSKEEMAFYEALRRQALEKIENTEGTMEQKKFQILAEITKLRRACCNPSLVTPDIELDSAKLAAFEEIVDELIENKHKALVFSQFIGHLDIIRKLLEKKQIVYQYLDGSTPLKEREKNIATFQAGGGDLFLISLKAGGLGLNLTAADYVIHLDPWWNPAIEDQASDRAHRMGQQKPVTIYKLITQNTIEEKIIKLHQNKRDLADSLLDGADISGKISADELLKLIKN